MMKLAQFLEFRRGDKLPLLPAEVYKSFPHNGIRIACHKLGIYSIPTVELVEFLKKEIADPNFTIEIGAGAGHLGHLLGIQMTDNKCQLLNAEINANFRMMNQPIPPYGDDVETLDALQAVEKYRPHTVVGSWISQFVPSHLANKIGGSPYGIREDILLNAVHKYIHIGNEGTHKDKFILKRPHRKIKAPWLISRSMYPHNNVIYIWEKQS